MAGSVCMCSLRAGDGLERRRSEHHRGTHLRADSRGGLSRWRHGDDRVGPRFSPDRGRPGRSPGRRLVARRRDQAGSRSQPGHLGPASQSSDVRLLAGEPAGGIQADADVHGCAPVADEPVDADDLGRPGRHRRPSGHDHLQRRPVAEPALGRWHDHGDHQQQPRNHHEHHCAVQSELQQQLVGALCAAAAPELQDRQHTAADPRDKAEPGHFGNPASSDHHQHAVERPERLLGLRVCGAVGRGRTPVRCARRTARLGQPDAGRGRDDGADRRDPGAIAGGDAASESGDRRGHAPDQRARPEAAHRQRHTGSQLGRIDRPDRKARLRADAG